MDDAVAYTTGMLMAVSKSLPPIVKDLSLSEPNLVVGQPVQINFTILENRTSAATVYITIDGEKGTPIISAEYKTGVDKSPLGNVSDSELNALPFAGTFSIPWDGTMPGTPLDSGHHKLYVRASDADGNFSDAAVVEFFLDAGGPRVSVGSMINTFYVDYQGVSMVSPAGTNPAMLGIAGVDMQLLVRDESSGVKSIKLSKLAAIGDSTGTVVYSKLFPEPTGLYAEPALPLLADGPYRLEAADWDGNRTVAPFQLGSIESPSVITESPVVYHPGADNYDVTLRVAAKSSYTLKKMELLGDDEAVLETRALDLTQSSQAFTVRGILSAVTPGAYEKTYYARTADASGQTLSQYKIFQAAAKDAPLAGAVREKSSPVMDLTALGLLPGGAAVLQDSPNFWGSLYYYYRERSDQSGPVTTAPPPTAQVQIYVQTGDTPMALGAESLVYSRTDFTRLIQAGDTVPPGCASAGETVPADTRVACFVSVASAVPLKRYVKVHAVGTQAQPDGIYYCVQYSPDDFNYCLNGSKYPELVLNDDLSGMIRGLAHADSMAALTGAPGTYLAAGQNVSVNLGDILTVTIANVAQPGYLSAAFVTPQGYPGLAPLASFLLNAPAPAAYSGQIGFTVKYPAGLTAGQEGGITAYQIVTDPESGIRLMKPLAAQINTAAKEVSFYADSLGEFLVAAPKYTTPWTLASAPAPDGQPELSAISNNGALSQRMLEPGSQEARDAGALLAGLNLFPAGNIFHVGPDDTALEPAAALKMRYTDADLADRGLTESELGLYEFSADAKVMMKLPNQVLDPVRNEITGEVPHLYSLFAILGSSRGEQVPLGEDTTPPVTNAVPSVPPYQSGGMVFVSTAADIYLDAYDPEVAGAATSGVDNTDYVLDLAEGQPEVPVLYTGPLRLSEGMHTLGFASRDKRGNDEEKRTATFYADGTPPVSTCAVLGEGSADNGNLVLVEGSSVAISAVDPESQGFASGLGMIVFDISTSPCAGFSDYPSAPGQCRKLLYTGAFSLGVGTHTLYYAAMDNVGNMSEPKSVSLEVRAAVATTLLAGEKTATSILWRWDLVEGATGYQVFSSTGGGEVLSGILAAGATVYAQTGLMPNTVYTASLLVYTPGGIQRSDMVSVVTLANVPMSAESFLSGQNASVVLGQESFYTKSSGSGPNQLTNPAGVAMDGAGNLWVADSYNHRVLRYSAPLTTGKSADLVIGQSSLYMGFSPSYMAADNLMYPRSITFDRNGRLWVADGRGRVLRFSPPFITGMGADRVIGAANFTSWPSGPVAANRFCSNYSYQSPHVGSDASGSLWVSDTYCHRVLRFSEPFYNGMSANLVLGQQDFSSSAGTSQLTARTLSYPYGVGFDLEDNIWVADRLNMRVLKFEQPYSDGKAAAVVVGQPDFNSRNTTEWNTVTRNKLSYPSDVDFDGQGSLYVADDGNNRVLQFRPPFSAGMDADVVIGQPNFNTRATGVGPSTLSGDGMYIDASGFVYTDPQGRIWVSDKQNNRVMLFEPGGNSSFNDVGSSSFTLQWDSAFNSPQTVYLAEISQTPSFTCDVTASGEITSVSHAFPGLEGGARYYARVRAKNLDGIYSEYLSLGSIQLKPIPLENVTGVAASSSSIIWSWAPALSGTYQLFSSTGEVLSEVLAVGTSWYLQTGLTPNTTYSCFVRVTNESGASESSTATALTSAAAPGLPQSITNGQAADYVLGQIDFASAVWGRTASAVGWISHAITDKSGSLWVTDEGNSRILKFDPPLSAGMSASLVIGQADFTSLTGPVARNRLNNPRAATFDAEGRLWVSDAWANRILMFNPPFFNGMDADLVIGQPDFTSYEHSAELSRLYSPAGLALDMEGGLWVADSKNNRVLRFLPPFFNGMPASVSISYSGSSLLSPAGVAVDSENNLWVADTGNGRVLKFVSPVFDGMPASIVIKRKVPENSPYGLAFDSDGDLYVAESQARVLHFKKPFSTNMNASSVLGQKDLYSYERGLSSVSMSAPVYGVAAGGDGRVWVADRNNKRALGFRRSPFTDIGQQSLMAGWDTGANPSGTLYRVEVATSPDYAATIMTEWTGASSSTIFGLLPGTTYYARVRAKNFAGAVSEPLHLGTAATLSVPLAYSRSEALVGGKPEVSLASLSEMSVGPVDGGTSGAQVALGAVASQGLIAVSPIYNVGPEGLYDPPAMMGFYYSSSAVSAMGIPESELAVYEYFSGTGWVRLDGQILDTFNKKINVPLTNIASLFGIFVKAEDWSPPATEFTVAGSSYMAATNLNIGTGTVISLSASDAVVYGTSSGVAFTEFRVDASSAAPFAPYSEPFQLSTGPHKVEFRSGDNAGNLEETQLVEVFVDGLAPSVRYAIAGSSFSMAGGIYAAVGSTLTLISSDTESGINALFYEISGATYAAGSGVAEIYLSSGGAYPISYFAEDNVGNRATLSELSVFVDSAAPASLLLFNNTLAADGWYSSSVIAEINPSDDGSGVMQTHYRLNGSSFSVYSATFAVVSEGRHVLDYYSLDNVLNSENVGSASFGIDISTPQVGYFVAPAANAYGWNNSPVDVVFTGTDAVSGIAYCSSSFTVRGEGLGIPISGYCADYAGWTSTASFSLNIDTTAPVSNAGLTAEHGLNGWLLSPAIVALASTDGLSGPGGLYYSVDGSSFTLYSSSFPVSGEGKHRLRYYAEDKADNREGERSLELKLDLTAPSVVAISSPVANNSGWNNTAVAAVFSGTDSVSGLAYCEPDKLLVTEGSSQAVSGYCMDYAGRSSTASVVVNIDTTGPSIGYAALPAANEVGWNNGDVTLKFSCVDALSGVGVCPGDIVLTQEGIAVSTSVLASDNAGNLSAIVAAGFKVDKTAPVIGFTRAPLPNEAGWNNEPVRVAFSGSDTLSGVLSCSSSTVSLEGAAQAVGGWCRDIAGNIAYASATVNIDLDSPIVSAAAVPAPNEGGWNNSPVTIEFSCSDELSGVGVCPVDIRLTGEGVGISTSASAYDLAGNIGMTGVFGIKIDLAAPVSTAALAGVYRNGWYSSPVAVVLASTDALAGVKGVMYSLDGEAYAVYNMPLNVSGDGEHSLKYYAVDSAGNVEAVKSVEFKIDTSLPEIAYSQVPVANVSGWNNSSVQVVFTGSDTLSGIEECSSVTIAAEGAAQRVPGWCRDVAGNVAYATSMVNVDLTPAVIELNSPLAGQTYIATRGKIGVDFAVTDNLDPAPGAEAFLVQVEDKGSPRGARPARIAVADGQFIEPLDIDDGLWRLATSAADFADNTSYLEGGVFEVIHDVLAPRSAGEASGPVYGSVGGNYLTSAAQFELRSNDDLVAAADGLGLGVRSQEVKLIAGELPLKELSFQNPQPRQGTTFVSTFGFVSLGNLPDGRYRLSYAAEDILANKEQPADWAFALDNTPPFTTFGVTGAAFNGEDRVFVTGLSGLSLAGVDVSSSGVASGLLLTKYKLNDGSWQVYAGSFTIVAEGRHTLTYYSIDNVQNAEQQLTRTIIVDNAAPEASLSLGEPRYEVFGLQLITPETPVSLAAGDPGADASGVKAIYYKLTGADGWSSGLRAYLEPFKIGRQGTFLVRYWAVDNVGNLGAAKEEKLRVSDLRADALDAAEGLDMAGTADIAGTVRANGVVSLGGNARILGDVWASTITLTGKAQITGQAHNGAVTLTPAPLEMADMGAIASATNNNALIPAKYLSGGKLVVSSKDTLTLSTGVYYLAGLELAGGAVVNLDGKVDILVAGAVSIGGGSALNAAGAASSLNMFLSTDSVVTVLGGGSLVAYVYAPYSHMKLAGNALLGGHFFVKTAAVSGTGNIIQSGESLPKTASATEDTGGKKRVSALAAGDTAYSVLSGPDPAFRLGEVYVYPNPALRGAAPVLHIETGIADRVKISIYTVSGRQAHEHTLTGMPVALDDGNGLSYAYEYVWRDSIPSGVYYYHIEAEKGGQKIRKSGKFAVVR